LRQHRQYRRRLWQKTCLSWHGPTNSGRQLSSQTSPLLIEGEDAATYDELLAHMLAAVKPVDVIDEMLIVDVASLEWEFCGGAA